MNDFPFNLSMLDCDLERDQRVGFRGDMMMRAASLFATAIAAAVQPAWAEGPGVQGQIAYIETEGAASLSHITPLDDGGFIVAGSISLDVTGADVYVSRLDKSLRMVWGDVVGGTGFDYATALSPFDDGRVFLLGVTDSGYNTTAYMLPVSIDGIKQRAAQYRGLGKITGLRGLAGDGEGGAFLAGYTSEKKSLRSRLLSYMSIL